MEILTNAKQIGIKLIKEHRWRCDDCDLKLFFRCDLDDWYSREKLAQHERAVSNHIFINHHSVTHEEKDTFKINYK